MNYTKPFVKSPLHLDTKAVTVEVQQRLNAVPLFTLNTGAVWLSSFKLEV